MAIYKCGGTVLHDEDGEPLCTYQAPRPWLGRCPHGHLYKILKVGADKKRREEETLAALLTTVEDKIYLPTGEEGFDFVIGDGLVPGSVYLFGGRRGTGKSTLLLEVAVSYAKTKKIVYAGAEEHTPDIVNRARQVASADALAVASERLIILGNATDIDDVLNRVEEEGAKLFVLDAVQACMCGDSKGAAGSTQQSEQVVNAVNDFCKQEKVCAILINHVDKAGDFKGGTMGQHLVDAILFLDYYEPDEANRRRIVRAGAQNLDKLRFLFVDDKNRHGDPDREAYYEMTGEGMKFLSTNQKKVGKLISIKD